MQTRIVLVRVSHSVLIKAQGKAKTLPRMEHPSFAYRVNKYYHFQDKNTRKEVEDMVTTLRLPEELHKRLKREAALKGMTLNAYILMLLWTEKGDNR